MYGIYLPTFACFSWRNRVKCRYIYHTYCWWKKSCTTWDVWNPINNGIIIILGGAGFQPSTVWMPFLWLSSPFFKVHLTEPKVCNAITIWPPTAATVSRFKLCWFKSWDVKTGNGGGLQNWWICFQGPGKYSPENQIQPGPEKSNLDVFVLDNFWQMAGLQTTVLPLCCHVDFV